MSHLLSSSFIVLLQHTVTIKDGRAWEMLAHLALTLGEGSSS